MLTVICSVKPAWYGKDPLLVSFAERGEVGVGEEGLPSLCDSCGTNTCPLFELTPPSSSQYALPGDMLPSSASESSVRSRVATARLQDGALLSCRAPRPETDFASFQRESG